MIRPDQFGALNPAAPARQAILGAPRQASRIRATSTRPHDVRQLISAYDVSADRLDGHK